MDHWKSRVISEGKRDMPKQIVSIAGKSCAQLVQPSAARPEIQQTIADRAFELWLARGFRNGSPQEDWMRAQQEIQSRARKPFYGELA